MTIIEQVNASKDTIGGEAVWDLLKDAEKVVAASGKKTVVFDPLHDRDEMLDKVRGRTGNLRAPTLRRGAVFYVGFNEEMYNAEIG